jgi:3-oxoacyl-[acyl-carrier protein] reductase
MHDFTDKAVLVTGSTRGIGRAVANLLVTGGAVVGINGRDEEKVRSVCKELSEAGGRSIPVAGDISDPAVASRAVQSFHKTAGRLDGLVNNAGGGKAVAFRGLTLDNWKTTFRLNLEAAMIASREAYIIMRKQSGGSIVNVASLAAHGPGKWMGADYAASKAGLVSMTKSLAFEAARFGIRVNAVSPGMVETDMTACLTDELKKSLGIPMGRLARPEEVASAVLFLLSDDAAYVTGEVLHVNGGLLM